MEGEGYGLGDARALRDLYRVRYLDWGAVRFVRGVGPVALVLHLEHVALEPYLGAHARCHLVSDTPYIEERLVRRYIAREVAMLDAAVGVLHLARQPGTFLYRVQHAEPDAVAQERGACLAIQRERDGTIRAPGDASLPREVYLALPVRHVVRDLERVVSGVYPRV